MRSFSPVFVTALVLTCFPVLGCSSESSESPAGTSGDAAPDSFEAAAPTQCKQGGGTCVPGYPDSTEPGYTVDCPAGSTLADGQSTVTSGGNDLIQSSLAKGCSTNPDGTKTPALCCYPIDGGPGDATGE